MRLANPNRAVRDRQTGWGLESLEMGRPWRSSLGFPSLASILIVTFEPPPHPGTRTSLRSLRGDVSGADAAQDADLPHKFPPRYFDFTRF